MPASLGGRWTTTEVCDDCQRQANLVADELVIMDFLVVFLRNRYEIGDRDRDVPLPPRFHVPLDRGDGTVKVTLRREGVALEGAMSPATAALLGLEGESEADRDRLRALVGDDVRHLLDDPVQLARAIQTDRTPPLAWSRFIAKLGLACGRKAYGDAWLDSPHARVLSDDLLSDGPPRLSLQREHVPPISETWPFEPPKHIIWIDDFQDIAMLHVVMFGQLLGAVAVNEAGAPSEYSAWRFDPKARNFSHSSYPAIWLGTVAARATATGRSAVTIMTGQPFVFVADGPDGPMDIPAPTLRAESPVDALRVLAEHSRPPAG
jgi:hypothetical protein